MPAAHLHAKLHKVSVGGAYASKNALQDAVFSILAEHLQQANHIQSMSNTKQAQKVMNRGTDIQ
jgi:hypothetical protein